MIIIILNHAWKLNVLKLSGFETGTEHSESDGAFHDQGEAERSFDVKASTF